MGYCNKAIHRYFKVIKMTWDHGFAVVGDDRIQKSMKIISCIEYVTKEELKGKKILEIGGGAGLISSAMSKYAKERLESIDKILLLSSNELPRGKPRGTHK